MLRIRSIRLGRFSLGLLLWLAAPVLADDPPKPESSLVRLLKSGRVPEERQPQIIAKIGQLGSAEDLRYLYDNAVSDNVFAPAVRVKALEALADAALTRKGLKPPDFLGAISRLIAQDKLPPLRLAAIRLAGTWKFTDGIGVLVSVAGDDKIDLATRAAAFDALGAMGEFARGTLAGPMFDSKPKAVRLLAAAALARVDAKVAAPRAATLIASADQSQDLVPLLAAFLDRPDGAAVLSKALDSATIPPDNAKLALRAVYAQGRADAPLVASLSKAAGISSETKPPTREEMDRLVADVASKGNAERGERILRRVDLSCMKCHAIAGAAGGVGPDLSSVGLSAPVDYVINSILLPDQAIKEQYHTLVVATNDGQVFQGIVADKDESKVVLRLATGELKTVPTSEIDESKEGGSLMPKGLANLLTRDEFLDLVRFISELGKPGPYAVHAKPTIQRWRLMRPVPEDLINTPDPGTFAAKIRDSDPSAWVPAYGLSTGEVPVGDFSAAAGSDVLYLRGEFDVSSGGEIEIQFGSTDGVVWWVDDSGPLSGTGMTWGGPPGKHTITLRIDTKDKKLAAVVVTLAKARGSSAEFTIVGGR